MQVPSRFVVALHPAEVGISAHAGNGGGSEVGGEGAGIEGAEFGLDGAAFAFGIDGSHADNIVGAGGEASGFNGEVVSGRGPRSGPFLARNFDLVFIARRRTRGGSLPRNGGLACSDVAHLDVARLGGGGGDDAEINVGADSTVTSIRYRC